MSTPAPSSAAPSRPTTENSKPRLPIDLYKPLPSRIQQSVNAYLPAGTSTHKPSNAALIGVDEHTYQSRAAGKGFLLNTGHAPTTPSELVRGKKRNRGNEASRSEARREAEQKVAKRETLGSEGLRKVRKRPKLREAVGRGMQINYESLLPLHYLHCQYLVKLLNLPPLPLDLSSHLPPTSQHFSPEALQSKLSKADFTGLLLSIKSSSNHSLTGLGGIVIEETGSTFRLIPKDGRARVVPKAGTLFLLSIPAYSPSAAIRTREGGQLEPRRDRAGEERVEPGEVQDVDMERFLGVVPRIELDLMGSNFCFRSGERAGRKFRMAQGDGGGNGWGEVWVDGDWRSVLGEVGDQGLAGEKGKNRRRRGKARRKDPPAWGNVEVLM